MSTFHSYQQGQWFGYEAKIFLDTLSNTKLNYLELLLRESIQNSFDAKIPGRVPSYSIHGRKLTADQSDNLRDMLPDSGNYTSKLKSRIKEGLFCLEIRDSNTTGLLGSYQQYDENGNEIESEYSNYKSFIWSLGGSKTNNVGGSHGVGKTSFYIASRIRTACIYTRTVYEGRYQSRLIMKSFYPYEGDGIKQYWLGDDPDKRVSMKDIIPLPFLDDEADIIAMLIGIKPFEREETGTSVFILDADFNIDEDNECKRTGNDEYYKENVIPLILKWFWPKLSSYTSYNKKISIAVFYESEEIKVPALTDSPYDFFSICFSRMKNKLSEISTLSNLEKCQLPKDKGFIPIASNRPKLFTGCITYAKTAHVSDQQKKMFFSENNNICLILMRDIEFCVKYKGYLSQDLGQDEYVFAIFHTDPINCLLDDPRPGSVDNAFRLAEDNSHEEWNPNFILNNPRAKSCVKVSLLRIDEAIGSEFSFKDTSVKAKDTSGALALHLGKLLPWNHGLGGSRRRSSDDDNPTPRTGGTPRVRMPNKFVMKGAPQYLDDGTRRLRFELQVKNAVDSIVYPRIQIRTADGAVDAGDIVVLEKVLLKIEGSSVSMVASSSDSSTISLKQPGTYSFIFLVKGDVEFSCELKREKE